MAGTKQNLPSLEWCVAGTLAWFAVLGRPLTVPEVERLLLRRKANQRQIHQALVTLGSDVRERNGRYTLAAAKVQWPDEQSERWYRHKWRRLRIAVRLIRWLPYVRLVAAANTLADRTATKESDIDVFIVTKHGRMYLTRTLITAVLHIFGLRRHGEKIANRVCLSFFVTDGALDLSAVAFEPYDIYLAYWVAELWPVLETPKTHQNLLAANAWAGRLVPGYDESDAHPSRSSGVARTLERLFDSYFGDWLEQRLAAWQEARIRADQDRRDPDVLIVATDRMLKFHEKERRKAYRSEWEGLMRRAKYDPAEIL